MTYITYNNNIYRGLKLLCPCENGVCMCVYTFIYVGLHIIIVCNCISYLMYIMAIKICIIYRELPGRLRDRPGDDLLPHQRRRRWAGTGQIPG